MKSKKMTKSTFAIIIMAIAMVAMLAFGGTYAYFTATAGTGKQGSFHTAKVELTTEATAVEFAASENFMALLPSETLTATIDYADSSTRGTWVFFRLSESMPSEFTLSAVFVNGTQAQTTSEAGVYAFENSTAGTEEGDPTDVVASAELTVTFTITFSADAGNTTVDSGNATLQDQDFVVTIEACSVQHKNLEKEAALAESAFAPTQVTPDDEGGEED